MAAKSKIQYWNGSAWTDIASGSSNNPVIRLTIDDKMGQPQMLEALLSNRAPNPFSANAADAKGSLTGVFTDFMKVRVIDPSTQIVYFLGRLYSINDKYDMSFGSCIHIVAFDALQELKNNVTDGQSDISIVHDGANTYPTLTSPNTSVDRRSGLIKGLISIFSRAGNISFGEGQVVGSRRFNDSQNQFSATFKYPLKKGGNKSALSHISTIAKDDSQDAGKTTFTYDFYIDPNVQTRTASTEGISQFNYFKRGTVPGGTPATYGLRVEYPAGGGLTKTGRIIPMMADYDFSKPKDELFTEVVTHYKDEGIGAAKGASGENDTTRSLEPTEKVVHMELIKVKSISGAFTWSGKAIGGGTVGTDSVENLTYDGDVVAKIQWISATSGGTDGSPEYALISDVNSTDFPSGVGGTFTGASSSSTFVLVGRPSVSFGVIKIARLGAADVSNADVIREQAVSRLKRSTETLTRGRVRIHQKPSFYVESSSTTVSSNTITFGDISALISYGVKQGATVNKVSSTGVVQAYGYVTTFNNNSVTIDSASGFSNGDTVRVYIPVRASNLCYIVNRMVGITGSDFLITEVNYVEDNGVMTAELELVEATNGMGARDNPIGKAIDSVLTNENYKEDSPTNPKDVKSTVTFTLGGNGGANPHTTLSYSAGEITAGGTTFKINAGTLTFVTASNYIEQYVYHTGVEGVTSLSTQRKAGGSTNYDFSDKDRILLLWVRNNDMSVPEDLVFSTDPLNPSNLESIRGGFNGSKGLNNTGTIKLNQDLTAQAITFSSRTAYPRVDFTSGGILGKSDASTVQFSLNASSGKGVFGAGEQSTIGADGIKIKQATGHEGGVDGTHPMFIIENADNVPSTGAHKAWKLWIENSTAQSLVLQTTNSNANNPAFMPNSEGVISLGHSTFTWKRLYLDGDDGAVWIGNKAITRSGDALHWDGSAIGGGSTYTAGTGITLSGTEFSLNQGVSPTWTGNHNFNGNVYMNGGTIHIGNSSSDTVTIDAKIAVGGYAVPGIRWVESNGTAGLWYDDSGGTYSRLYFVLRGMNSTNYMPYFSSDGNYSWMYSSYVQGSYLRAYNGSASFPSHSFINDSDTGMYLDSALVLGYGGSARLYIGPSAIRANWDIDPQVNQGYNLGSSSYRWHTIFSLNDLNTPSDAELKENKTTITNGLEFISSLNPISFNRIGSSDIQFGFTAQEVKQAVLNTGYTENAAVYSEEINEDTGETEWGMTYAALIAPLVASIKELKERIEVLEGN